MNEKTKEPLNLSMEILQKLFSQCIEKNLSTLLSKEVSVVPQQIVLVEKEIPANFFQNIKIIIDLGFSQNLEYSLALGFSQQFASILVDLMLLGEGKPSETFSEEDKDALSEAFNQILSSFALILSKVLILDLKFEPCQIRTLEENTEIPSAISKNLKSPLALEFSINIKDVVADRIILVAPQEFVQKIPAQSEEIFKKEVEEKPIIKEAPVQETFAPTPPKMEPKSDALTKNIELILDIEVPIIVKLGESEMSLQEVLKLGPGSIIELNRRADAPVELLVNNKLIAKGEVVVVDANFGLKVSEIESPLERIKKLR